MRLLARSAEIDQAVASSRRCREACGTAWAVRPAPALLAVRWRATAAASTPSAADPRALAVRAPVPQVLPGRAVEDDDAAVAVAVGDEHLVVGRIDPDLRRASHQRRVVAAAGLVELADHQRRPCPVRVNFTVRLLSRAFVHTKSLWSTNMPWIGAPVAVRAARVPRLHHACPADPTRRCGRWLDVQTWPRESAKMPITCPHLKSAGSLKKAGSGLKVRYRRRLPFGNRSKRDEQETNDQTFDHGSQKLRRIWTGVKEIFFLLSSCSNPSCSPVSRSSASPRPGSETNSRSRARLDGPAPMPPTTSPLPAGRPS